MNEWVWGYKVVKKCEENEMFWQCSTLGKVSEQSLFEDLIFVVVSRLSLEFL